MQQNNGTSNNSGVRIADNWQSVMSGNIYPDMNPEARARMIRGEKKIYRRDRSSGYEVNKGEFV